MSMPPSNSNTKSPILRRILVFAVLVALAGIFYLRALGWYQYLDANEAWQLLMMDPIYLLFLVISLVGVAGRFFWGRLLVVCFSANMLALYGLRFLDGHGHHLLDFATALLHMAALALLTGQRAAAYFEGTRRSRFNRWAAAAPEVTRLRWIALAMSVLLTILFCGPVTFGLSFTARLVLTGTLALGLLGFVFQKTWSLFLLLGTCLLILPWLALYGAGLAVGSCWAMSGGVGWVALALALLLTGGTLALGLPVARRIWLRLRG